MTAAAPSAYVAAASETIQELVRIFKVRRLYGEDHPQRVEVEDQAVRRIANLLDLHGTIEFGIEPDRVVVTEDDEAKLVHRQDPGLESMPHLLHREGIRKVVLYAGLTLQETMAFMDDLVAASRSGDDDLDLLSRLWGRQFYHLRYFFVERLQDEEWVPPAAEQADAAGEEGEVELAEEDAAALVDDEARVRISDFDSTLYFLDDEDLAVLQAELEAEKERELVRECLTCLRELLLRPVTDDPGIVLDAIEELHDRLLDDAAYDDVRALHEIFEPYLASGACDAAGRALFAELRGRAIAPETLDQLAAQLESGAVGERGAAAYYRTFGAGDAAALLGGARELKRLCQRPAIAEVFVEMARAEPDALVDALAAHDPAVASAAAYLAGLVTDPRTLDGLGRALTSEDADLRRDAVQALKHFGGGRALELVSDAVDDPDPAVRLYALRHIVLHRYAPALARVAPLVEGEEWRERTPTEQRLLFEAYGALGGETVLDDLSGRLRRRGFLRRTDPEEMACAIVGLGATRSPAAREIVEEACDSRHPLVSRVATQVLDEWAAGRPA